MRQPNQIRFHRWLQRGIAEGWCSNGFCSTHGSPQDGGVDMDLYENPYEDECIFVLAVFEPKN